ncbi:MAG: hypothetical protein ACMUIG_09180 [Thermoplasmatota archaeon]
MNELMLFTLYLMIPGFVYLLTAAVLVKKYRAALREIRIEPADEDRMTSLEYQKLVYLAVLPMTPFFYGSFLFIYLMTSGDLLSYQWDLVKYIGIFLCTANVLSTVGTGYYYYNAVDEFASDPRIVLENGKPYNPFLRNIGYSEKTKRMIRKQTFGKHLALGIGPTSISVFALVAAVLIISYSGMTPGGSSSSGDGEIEETIDHPINATRTDEVEISSCVMVTASVITFFTTLFLPKLIEGSVRDRRVFIKRMAVMFLSQFPMVIGLAIFLFVIF